MFSSVFRLENLEKEKNEIIKERNEFESHLFVVALERDQERKRYTYHVYPKFLSGFSHCSVSLPTVLSSQKALHCLYVLSDHFSIFFLSCKSWNSSYNCKITRSLVFIFTLWLFHIRQLKKVEKKLFICSVKV